MKGTRYQCGQLQLINKQTYYYEKTTNNIQYKHIILQVTWNYLIQSLNTTQCIETMRHMQVQRNMK